MQIVLFLLGKRITREQPVFDWLYSRLQTSKNEPVEGSPPYKTNGEKYSPDHKIYNKDRLAIAENLIRNFVLVTIGKQHSIIKQ